jgi:hypothetical protein
MMPPVGFTSQQLAAMMAPWVIPYHCWGAACGHVLAQLLHDDGPPIIPADHTPILDRERAHLGRERLRTFICSRQTAGLSRI